MICFLWSKILSTVLITYLYKEGESACAKGFLLMCVLAEVTLHFLVLMYVKCQRAGKLGEKEPMALMLPRRSGRAQL